MHAPYLVPFQVDMNNGEVEMLAQCESCAATDPHTSVAATTHSLNTDWSGYQLCDECAAHYDSVPSLGLGQEGMEEPDEGCKATCPECERTNLNEAGTKCRDCSPEVGA